MLKAAAEVTISMRQYMAGRLAELTQEQWTTQPEGFANNVAWNVGHLIVAQQGLCYSRLGLPTHVDADKITAMRAMYSNGTSPADWTDAPDTAELLALFVESPKQLVADVEAGLFDNYVKPEPTGEGLPPAESVAHGFIFNQHHEGTHFGNISDILGMLG